MKLIIAGSRHLHASHEEIADILTEKLGSWSEVEEVVSGHAKGIDSSGEDFAKVYQRKLTVFPADWDRYGKMAGPRRNGEMAAYADALLLIWDGKSRGSANMKAKMVAMKKPVYEIVR